MARTEPAATPATKPIQIRVKRTQKQAPGAGGTAPGATASAAGRQPTPEEGHEKRTKRRRAGHEKSRQEPGEPGRPHPAPEQAAERESGPQQEKRQAKAATKHETRAEAKTTTPH